MPLLEAVGGSCSRRIPLAGVEFDCAGVTGSLSTSVPSGLYDSISSALGPLVPAIHSQADSRNPFSSVRVTPSGVKLLTALEPFGYIESCTPLSGLPEPSSVAN